MIDNQWYAVAESDEVRTDRPLGVTRFGEKLVLYRDPGGGAVCFRDRCCHRGAALSPGRIIRGELECPYHGFRFDSRGSCQSMPCQGERPSIPSSFRLSSFPVAEHGGLVWVWRGDERAERPAPPWFDDLPTDLRGSATYREEWPFHFSRVMEQMFDLHHAPHAHRTIGGGLIFGSVIEGVDAELAGDLIRFRGMVRRESGAQKGTSFEVTARLSIACLRISPKIKALVVVTPIDEERCWLFVRLFQTYTRIPFLRWLIAQLLLLSDFRLAQPQDKKIIASQTPAVSDLREMKLVTADRGILMWHKLYERLDVRK